VLVRIEERCAEAEAKNEAMGAGEYLRCSYSSGKPSPDFTELKEAQYFCIFARQYNEVLSPKLVWVRRNQPGSGRADFTVYDENKCYLRDIEVTALFSTPAVKDPSGYQDFSPYPIQEIAPDAMLLDIDNPRPGYKPYARLPHIIKKHLRSDYPPYWLVIYDNEHGVEHPNLADLGNRVRSILDRPGKRGKIPRGLKEVWVFDMPNAAGATLLKAWP
jgi:hypothetical protein